MFEQEKIAHNFGAGYLWAQVQKARPTGVLLYHDSRTRFVSGDRFSDP